MNRLPQLVAFLLFVALCASTAYWAMQVFKPTQRSIAAPPITTSMPLPPLSSASGLMGGRSSFAVSSNYLLKGVVVASNPAESVAILVIDGKSPQAIRANSDVLPGVTIKEVNKLFVLISEGGVVKRVDLPVETRHK